LGNYRQIIKTPSLEICGLFKTAHEPGPINQMMEVLLNASNGMIHPCPYRIGPFRMSNYTGKNANTSFIPLPSGDYKSLIKFYNDYDPKIGNIVSKYTFKEESSDDFK